MRYAIKRHEIRIINFVFPMVVQTYQVMVTGLAFGILRNKI